MRTPWDSFLHLKIVQSFFSFQTEKDPLVCNTIFLSLTSLEFAYFNHLMQNSSQLNLHIYICLHLLYTHLFLKCIQNEIYIPEILTSAAIQEVEGDDISFRCPYFSMN